MFSTDRKRAAAKSDRARHNAEPSSTVADLVSDRASLFTLTVYTAGVVGLLALLASYQS